MLVSFIPISPSRIRILIISLSFATLAPVIGLVMYLNAQTKNHLEIASIQQLSLVAQIATVEHLQIVEGARQLLIAITSSPEIFSRFSCSEYLSDLLTKFKRYSNFGIVDLNGNIYCSAITSADPANVSDKYFFQETLRTNAFTIGQFAIGQITKKATIYFGHPVHDARGATIGIAYVSLDLSWLTELLKELSLDQSIRLWVLDRNGSVLAHAPDTIGHVGSMYPNFRISELLERSDGEFFDKFNNEYILYTTRNIGIDKSGPYIILEIPETVATAKVQENTKKYTFISIGILLFSLGLGTMIGTILLEYLMKASKKIDELKQDFVSLASHQIRTPLTAIRWNTEHLLSLRPGIAKQYKHIVEDIHTSASRIISLVALLLDTSKLESGTIRLTTAACSLDEIAQEVVNELPKNQKKNCNIRVHFQKNLPKILIDAKLLKQVFANLIQNAIQYSPSYSVISITIQKKESFLLTSVVDQGIGVPISDRTHLFDKFFRAKNAMNSSLSGSGLGLYLAKLIIEGHGGKIWFEERKKGSCFAFRLPLV